MNIHQQRLKEFQSILSKEKLDGYAVTRTLDLGFLTGFHLDGYMMLAGKKGAWAFLPQMLLGHFRQNVNFCPAFASTDAAESLTALSKKKRLSRVGFDPDYEPYKRGMLWKKSGFKEKPGLVENLRETKKGAELEALKKACKIAAKAFAMVAPKIRPGRTELSVALELEHVMQSMGAKGPSFDTIIGAGANAALPHHCTSERRIKRNEAVLIDFGCIYNHYHSDMTRTIFMGRPDAKFREIYSIVEKSQKAGIAEVRSGAKAFDVDKACRDLITKAGYGKQFIHGTGHGIGLEIHESPRVNTKSKAVLKTGMAVTVEPGIYLPGKFGVRIEDSVLVTDFECEILTSI